MQKIFQQIASLHVKMDTLTLEVRHNCEVHNDERISRTLNEPTEDTNLFLYSKFPISSMEQYEEIDEQLGTELKDSLVRI